MLTLDAVAKEPMLLTFEMRLPTDRKAIFRPLVPEDETQLAHFLEILGKPTRRFYSVPDDVAPYAKELCEAINRYDKLRLVLEIADTPNAMSHEIIGIVEFSFDLVNADIERYATYGIQLVASSDCRFGLCLSDRYQNLHIGSQLFPFVSEIAQRFGQTRIILWGGVYADNALARQYYARNGFEELGTFEDSDGGVSVDMIYAL
ncbi:MAG: GNAT family N-acetyltransferase [Chloroflexota bacterium]